jgi:hypothetical protein
MAKELPVIQPGQKPAGQKPIFEKIGIVGLGLIGGSIALKARELWPTSLVIAVDNKDVLETAMRLHAIDVAAEDLIVLAEADLVVLAAPVKQNIALLAELDEHVRQPAVVTDTGSTKRDIVAAASALPPRFTFIGGHPLAGAARGGLDHARPDLFAGRPWLLTPETMPADGARAFQASEQAAGHGGCLLRPAYYTESPRLARENSCRRFTPSARPCRRPRDSPSSSAHPPRARAGTWPRCAA